MEWIFALFALALMVGIPVAALAIAIRALVVARGTKGAKAPPDGVERRISDLERQVDVLRRRVRSMSVAEQAAEPGAPATEAAVPAEPAERAERETTLTPAPPAPPATAPTATSVSGAGPSTAPPSPAAPAPAPPSRSPAASADLEHRIGARWATWVGVLALLFAAAFFLQWSIKNDIIGPRTQVVLGMLAGVALLVGGLLAERRTWLPYFSAGLSGGGLAILYLSLWAAFSVYGFVGQMTTFGCMFLVTVAGSVVSVAMNRQPVAILTVLGGLLTPILVSTGESRETVLLVYMIVLQLLVLAVARYRSWPALNRLAWVGMILLLAPVLAEPAERPVVRLLLTAALFVLFLVIPIARAWADREPVLKLDLGLVLGNAAAYYSAVYYTLDTWRPILQAPWALALGFLYMVLAVKYLERVPSDRATYSLHLSAGAVFLTLSIPLAMDGPWVTLAWAAQGVAFVWVARQVRTPVAPWGAMIVMLMAAIRVVGFDPMWYPAHPPVWNVTFLVHLVVVAAFGWAGWLASGIGDEARESWGVSGEDLRALLWTVGVAVLTVLLWREPTGLWPAVLLALEAIALAAIISRLPKGGARALVISTGAVAIVAVARVLIEDHDLARSAADSLINLPLVVRIGLCVALALASRLLAGAPEAPGARALARGLAAGAGVLLLVVLSSAWVLHQDVRMDAAGSDAAAGAFRLRLQVGLSVLWALYGAATLAWGFVRVVPAARYAGLALLGLTTLKVGIVDTSELEAIYRIASFVVLGIVLLGVSYIYQRLAKPR